MHVETLLFSFDQRLRAKKALEVKKTEAAKQIMEKEEVGLHLHAMMQLQSNKKSGSEN